MDFGNVMRGLRTRADMTILAAALHLEVSRQTVMRMEDGLPTKLGTLHIHVLLDQYKADRTASAEALRLWAEIREQDKVAKVQGNSKGFWRAYTDQIAPNFPKFLRLESAAEHIVSHQMLVIPGLLQIPDYRRAIIQISEPELSTVDLERRLELTAQRQVRLEETDFRLEVLLSESVLRHRPSSPAIMVEQLRALAAAGDRENVSIRIVPFAVGPHPGLAIHSFTLLRFAIGASGLTLPSVVFVEGAIGSMFHEHEDEVGQYQRAIEGLRAVALTEEDTSDLVFRVAKEYAA
ncbi:helix-turn-helix domain-containing protein [Nocardia sp. 2]|uniref:Helix-turn-helix domain-containing protein n=1 Tax=Nocardia acididurans TaxID=2802282 RepID=A0ABS1M6C8_9NOCA|nr:DUF5753 domain-containing protein [Nocardia acididurans]MBL1076160.1 helix-turn-helix domain-containing protein [Nocardia acididurans]